MSAKKRRNISGRAEPVPETEELEKEAAVHPPEEPEDDTALPEEQPDSMEGPGPREEDVKEPELPVSDDVPKRVVCCPVCGGSGEEHVKQGDLSVCKCGDCGLVFQNPRPSVGSLAAMRNGRFVDAMVKPHGREIREQGEIARGIMKMYHHRTSGRPAVLNAFGKHVIEVNCGLGFRLREFQRYGWIIDGIDTSRNAVEYAKGCSLDVEQLWLDTATFKPRTFDLILFQDNFGELGDPVSAVVKCSTILKPAGFVYVHLPPVDELRFDEQKLFYYGSESLRRVFLQNGFTVVLENNDETGYFFWFRTKERSVKDATGKS